MKIIFASIFILLLPDLVFSNDVTFHLTSESIQYVSISPPISGEYQVVIQLFGPAVIKLKNISSSNIGSTIYFTIADDVILIEKISYAFESGMIGIGRWNSLHDALSQVKSILCKLSE